MKPNHDPLYSAWIILFFLSLLFTQSLWAGQDPFWYKNMDNQFGGYVRLHGEVTGYDNGSYFEPVGTDTGMDSLANVRLTDKLILSETVYFEAHYEAFLKQGDTYEKQTDLRKYFPALPDGLTSEPSDIDNTRLLDLTKTVKQTDDSILWNRLDRLFFSIKASWGDIIVGRQAVTWGSGLIFNPMDLFNPFSPSDIVRDYKMGDDLISVGFSTERFGECNLLYVPRRDRITGEVDFKSSSVAGKSHFFAEDIEIDVMGALHYNEIVIGLGGTGYLGNAAWRSDLVWSTLKDSKDGNGYFEFVANIDYSWVWQKKKPVWLY